MLGWQAPAFDVRFNCKTGSSGVIRLAPACGIRLSCGTGRSGVIRLECEACLEGRRSDCVQCLGRDQAYIDDAPRGTRRAILGPQDSGKQSPVAHRSRVQERGRGAALVEQHTAKCAACTEVPVGIPWEPKKEGKRGKVVEVGEGWGWGKEKKGGKKGKKAEGKGGKKGEGGNKKKGGGGRKI
ncbi:hypothetical protein NDU88_000082 [Pleurodeles waltl]|uniref:Uncharacterized protein n=1 Tax=Pleurodeles waltl TaxID=8319 RepID=A0AAV7S8I9_PLEWA|nr:hypothetical protein NDU88_000082 [Pleurodeles waltl]